jgi:hypothetical protein
MNDLKINMWLSTARYNNFPVQIYSVDSISDPSDVSTIEEIADTLAYKKQLMSSGIAGFDFPAIAIATVEQLPKTIEIGNERKYILSPKNTNFILDLKLESHRRTLGNIFSRAFRSKLYPQLGKTMWQRSNRSRIYSSLKPEPHPSGSSTTSCEIDCDLFRGFRYSVDIFSNGSIGLSIDLHSTVLDRYSLSERIKQYGLDNFNSEYKGKYMVLADKDGKVKIRFIKNIIADKDISTFTMPNKYGGEVNVYDSFYGKNSKAQNELDRHDKVIVYTTHGEGKQDYYAPASCFYDIRSNAELEEDKDLKRMLIIEPQQRFQGIISHIDKFTPLVLGSSKHPSHELKLERQICGSKEFKTGVTALPQLLFGKGGTLEPTKLDSELKWRIIKGDCLKKFGIYRHSNIDSLLIIHPPMNETLLHEFYEDIRKLAAEWDEKLPEKFTSLITKDYTDILTNLEEFQDRFSAAIIIFKDWDEGTYCRIKGALKIPSQGVRLPTIYSKKRLLEKGRENHYRDIIFNIIAGLLGKSGAIPWVMARPLSCDCYIGVDSGGMTSRNWSYAFLFDNKGALVGSERGQAHDRESIEKDRFKNSFIQAINNYPKQEGPQRVVIHRDGRLTQTEKNGLDEAIIALQTHGKLRKDIDLATVDIKKSHNYRLFERGQDGFKNPFIGSYIILDENRALVNTTGVPVLSQGTAKPLLLDIDVILGKMSHEEIIKDIFYLSELNWGSPKMDTKMPITIQFAEKRIFYADKGIDYAGEIPL